MRAPALLAILLAAVHVPALAASHDTLTIGLAQFPANLHPNIAGQDAQTYADAFALRRVTTFDSTGAIVCLLCTEVPSRENGLARREGNGLAVTIKLRPDLAWGDGVPVTARDIAYTWQRQHDPASGLNTTHPWSRATSVEVTDDRTAVLHLDRTYVSFNLWDDLLSEHVDGPATAGAKTPADYVNQTPYNRAPTTPGLWNGPYLVESYRSNEAIGYVPNPHWAGPKPGFARVTIRVVENTAALAANLLSGDVDMTAGGIGLSIDQAMALERDHSAQFRVIYRPQLVYEHLELRLDQPALRDRRVREALLRAVDVRAIVDRLFGGHAELARSFINGIDPHFTPDVPTYPYDPGRARALLDEAGFRPGADGVRRNSAGERLAFEFATTAGNRIRELTQQVMQSQWRALGVEVSIKNQPSRVFFGEVLKRRQFTGIVEYASTLEPGLVPWLRLSSPSIPAEANSWAGQNYAGVDDTRLDELIGAAQFELDPARQQALWTEMQQIYASNLYGLPLYFREDPDVVPVWLDGYVATGKESWTPLFAEQWRPK